ncbi:MAG: nuclear transport factor 2 family protein [Coriobacteriia bacterium]|nr:nuclear transport factor 2 family protein [Coriobacteriia bacterium]MCL2750509.1 nuclear transport factor 2 family protein [Coriobacteriia bacterium]
MEYPVMTIEELSKGLWEEQQKRAIADLMADYWWYMDSKQWDKWAEVFTEDVELWMDDVLIMDSRDEFVEQNSTVWLANSGTAHQGHQMKIILTSETTAHARIILNDTLTNMTTMTMLNGFGYYFDDYRLCDDGKWRISAVRLGYFVKAKFNYGSEDETEFHEEVEMEDLPLL